MASLRHTPWLIIVGAVLCLRRAHQLWCLTVSKPDRPSLKRRESMRACSFAPRAASPTSGLGPVSTRSSWLASWHRTGMYTRPRSTGEGLQPSGWRSARRDSATSRRSSRAGRRPDYHLAVCDGVFLRRVYHHLTDPDAMAADLFAVVRPRGRVAIIDFEPHRWLSLISPASESRYGHGVPPSVVVAELTAAGFVLEARHDDWGSGSYCLVFVRPES